MATSASEPRWSGAAGRGLRWVWLSLALGAVLLRPALAHDLPHSVVPVAVLPQQWQLDLQLPADRLAVAMAHAAGVAPTQAALPAPTQEAVRAYVAERVAASVPGQPVPWAVQVQALQPPAAGTAGGGTGNDEWRVRVALQPPPGAAADVPALQLRYEVILREIATHTALVSMAQDWSRGVLPQHPVLVAALRGELRPIALTRGPERPAAAAASMFVLGLQHIAEGADHLLFLLALLITAPLQAVQGRWQPVAGWRGPLAQAGWRISAFTGGHSLSLLGAALGWLPPAGPGVEMLIALSVGITALHALRPLFPRREAWVAGAFGLVHGLAFAEVLSALQLPRASLLLATLSFNLGVEAFQLLLALLVLPWWMQARSQPWHAAARGAAALTALAAAALWAWQRWPAG